MPEEPFAEKEKPDEEQKLNSLQKGGAATITDLRLEVVFVDLFLAITYKRGYEAILMPVSVRQKCK